MQYYTLSPPDTRYQQNDTIKTQRQRACSQRTRRSNFTSRLQETTLQDSDWNLHLKHECLCDICTCNNHLCKLNPKKPNLRPVASHYKQQFVKQKCYNDLKIKRTEYPNPQQRVPFGTEYNKEFPSKVSLDHAKSAKYKDNLNMTGPVSFSSSYTKDYISKKTPNQRVPYKAIPTMLHNLPINARSAYQKAFRHFNPSINKPIKYTDTLKFDDIFFDSTCYRKDFIPKKIEPRKKLKKQLLFIPAQTLPLSTFFQKKLNISENMSQKKVNPAQPKSRNGRGFYVLYIRNPSQLDIVYIKIHSDILFLVI